jgi:hypothetical protein
MFHEELVSPDLPPPQGIGVQQNAQIDREA